MEPDSELAKVVDEIFSKINEGKPIDVCIATSPRLHDKVVPLLYTGYYISTLPKIQPSGEFLMTAKGRLMARLQEEERMAVNSKTQTKPTSSLFKEFSLAMQQVWQAIIGVKRIAVPVAIGLILIIVSAFGISNFISPAPALADGCTLSIISGNVEISGTAAGSQAGTNGMTLDVGTRVKTATDSSALLTFFDGSTVELKSDTDIEITQLESKDGESVTIVLKQWVGRTWSTVVKMADKGSRYQIDTPSAVALVRGTQFLVDVDDTGRTMAHTTRGLVSVFAEGEEVLVPPGQVTTVETSNPPSEPEDAPDPEDMPQPQSDQHPDNQGGSSNWAQNYNDTNKGVNSDWGQNTGNANGSENSNRGGNANPGDNSNAGGNAIPDDNSNAGGNANPGDNSNAGGNAIPGDNSNAGGNANPGDNSNAGGNANPGDNSNAGGNANPGDNSNAGGNANPGDNSNASGNANPGDNSNTGDNANPGDNPNADNGPSNDKDKDK
jgi:hypothetical protein